MDEKLLKTQRISHTENLVTIIHSRVDWWLSKQSVVYVSGWKSLKRMKCHTEGASINPPVFFSIGFYIIFEHKTHLSLSNIRYSIIYFPLASASLLIKMNSFKTEQHPTMDRCRAAKYISATAWRADPVTCTQRLFTDARSILLLFFFSFQAALCALSAALSCSTLIVD